MGQFRKTQDEWDPVFDNRSINSLIRSGNLILKEIKNLYDRT